MNCFSCTEIKIVKNNLDELKELIEPIINAAPDEYLAAENLYYKIIGNLEVVDDILSGY